jgi:hypothetical protein
MCPWIVCYVELPWHSPGIPDNMVRNMQPGSVIVDISVDQGGCVATTRPTTYANPTYVEHGIIHFAVTDGQHFASGLFFTLRCWASMILRRDQATVARTSRAQAGRPAA